jgi:glycosyltransferase involved in cell wall biosynthesis
VVFTSGLLFALAIRRSHRLIAVSETTRADLTTHYPRATERTTAIWPDTPLPVAGEPPTAAAVPWPYVLAVGAGTPNKNFARLAAAMTRLDPAAGVGLVHVGQDPAETFARAFAAVERPPPLLRLINVDDARLAALYRGALCLCAPSLYEGFCLPIVEAQKQGCPVLFADRSATAEIAGRGGLAVDPTDLDALVAALARVIAEPELRRALAAAGRENARRFCWDRTAERYEAVFAALLDGARGRTQPRGP